MNHHRTVAVIGASGFIGKALIQLMLEESYRVVAYSRQPQSHLANDRLTWRALGDWQWQGIDVIVNLAGERIDQQWTVQKKREFEESRVGLTEQIAESLKQLEHSPQLWINASAVGYYGDRGDELLNEISAPGHGYLADLCERWERATNAEALACRVVTVRIGMVLGRGGAAWEKLLRVFRWGLGARLGSGRQWMPWIHVDDLTRAMLWVMTHDHMRGPVNLVAPQPEQNREFTRVLAKHLRRPAPWIAPSWVIKTLFGGFGEFLLGGTRVEPQRLMESGFVFHYPHLSSALQQLAPDGKRLG